MTRLLPFLMVLVTTVASAKDLSEFSEPSDDYLVTARHVSEGPIVNGQIVMWVGKVEDVSVRQRADGATTLEWFCEQHLFEVAPQLPLVEPLLLKAEPTGHFVITLHLPTLSVSEVEEKIVKSLKSPAWVLVRGEPVFAEEWKGIKAVFLHSLTATVSDTVKVELAK